MFPVNRDSIDHTDPFEPAEGKWGAYEEYWYDALGRRVFKRVRQDSNNCVDGFVTRCQSSLERYVWDGDQMLGELRQEPGGNMNIASPSSGDQTGVIAYVHGGGIDAPLGMVRNDSLVILHQNWRGLFAFATTPSGALATCSPIPFSGCDEVEWPAGYWPTYLVSEQTQIFKWFGSLPLSHRDASGLLYRRNRYYDPEAGQFTQEDPIGIAGGLNLYGYANGDPINFSDPFGLDPCYTIRCLLRAVSSAVLGSLGTSERQVTGAVSRGFEVAEDAATCTGLGGLTLASGVGDFMFMAGPGIRAGAMAVGGVTGAGSTLLGEGMSRGMAGMAGMSAEGLATMRQAGSQIGAASGEAARGIATAENVGTAMAGTAATGGGLGEFARSLLPVVGTIETGAAAASACSGVGR